MSLARVKLREIVASDSPAYFKWINDRDTVIYNSTYSPISEASHNSWFNSAPENPYVRFFSITVDDENLKERLIGSCSLRSIDFISRSAELQIRVGDEKFRGLGFGTAAVIELLRFGFLDLNLRRIYLNVYATNRRARKSYEKAGFLEEGVKRQAAFVNGQYTDVVMMAVLRDDHENFNAFNEL